MSKAHYFAHIVVVGRRGGERFAERRYLNVPVDLATGNYERLSDLQLREALNDLTEERDRRAATQQRSTYDPFASQIRRPAPERNS